MESERVSSCCSSSSPSPASESLSSGEDAADRTEMEAAEALADLAEVAIMREKFIESAAKWGSKGKRVRKRVKYESPPCDSRLKPVELEPPAPDLSEERAAKEEQDAQGIGTDLTIVAVKTEVDDETPKQLLASSQRCRSSGGGRSRQNLSEAEREERRIRRILANRESARQTIRRRQAICEELNRKASNLSLENAQLKREKDWALKEFQSLETINKHLREQLSGSIKPETKEHDSPKASQVHTSTPTPLHFYNHRPSQAFCWPHVVLSTNSAVLPQNGFTVPSSTTSPGVSSKTEPSEEQQKLANDDGTKAPFYIVPCPWFLPPHDQNNGVLHSVFPYWSKNVQEDCYSNGHRGDNSSARPVEDVQSLPSHLPSRTKEGDSGSMETRPLYDLNEYATDISIEGGDAHAHAHAHVLGFHPERRRLSGGPSLFFKHEDASQAMTNGVAHVPNGQVSISLPEKSHGFVEYSSKRLVDTGAAAMARKRRKELTRLKNLHGRQCRMQV